MKEDKMERLLMAMENPSDFTDEELEQLFEDEELRDCYNLAVKAEQGFKMRKKALPRQEKPLIWKIAAIFVGLIMLSGITIAAIQYVRFLDDKKTTVQTTTVTTIDKGLQNPTTEESADTLRTFENEELEDILSEVASYYHLRTQYRDEQMRHIRLYIKWNKMQSAEAMVERLNGFEKVNITLQNDLLTAE